MPAFKHCPSQILSLICMALQPQIYLPADTVCALGSRAREMYFISKGTVTVHGAEGQVLNLVGVGVRVRVRVRFRVRVRVRIRVRVRVRVRLDSPWPEPET